MEKPADTLASSSELMEIARWVGRVSRAEHLLEVAGGLADVPDELDSDKTIHAALPVWKQSRIWQSSQCPRVWTMTMLKSRY